MLIVLVILFVLIRTVFSGFIAYRVNKIGFKRASIFFFFAAFLTSPLLMWLTLGDQLSDN